MTTQLENVLPPADTATVLNFLWNKCQPLDAFEKAWLARASDHAGLANDRIHKIIDQIAIFLNDQNIDLPSFDKKEMNISNILLMISDNLKTIESIRYILKEIND